MSKYRVTVDTGGTFSDFVFFNEDTGEITITKVPSTPKEPFQAVLNGVKGTDRSGRAGGRHIFFLPRHDGRHQRAPRRKGRQDRSPRYPRLSRHLRSDGADARLRPGDLRSLLREAALARAALFNRGNSRAGRFPRQRAQAHRRRSFSRGRAPAQEKRRAVGGRLLSFFVFESDARAQDQGNLRRRNFPKRGCRFPTKSCRRSASSTG